MSQLLVSLREKQATILTAARERLDQITANTDESRSAELNTQHDNAMAEFDRLQGQIDAIEAVESRAKKVEGAADRSRRPNQEDRSADPDRGGEGQGEVSYRHVFAKIVCGVDPSELTGEERTILRTGRTKFESRMQTTSNTAGGYTVPTELMNEIDRAMKDWGPMYDEDVARVITTTRGNSKKLPTVDDTAKSGGAHTEGTALTDDGSEDVVFGQKSLDAFAFDTEFVKFSWELESDSDFSFEALLGDLLGERLGRVANAQLTTGSGSSAPNGIVTASTAGKTAVSTTAFTADEVIDLLHSIDPAYRRSPKFRFMFHDLVLAAIRKLKDGQNNYLWQMGDVTKGVPPSLLGHNYSINQDMSSTFTTGQKLVLAGDFSRYYVRKVGAPIIGVLRERFWPDVGIAGLIRFDGELSQSAAVKHLKLA